MLALHPLYIVAAQDPVKSEGNRRGLNGKTTQGVRFKRGLVGDHGGGGWRYPQSRRLGSEISDVSAGLQIFFSNGLAFPAGAVLLAVLATSSAMAAESPPLTLQTKIPLGDVRGRIDHLAIDHARQRLFVAELGNNSLGVVDLKDQKVVHRVAGLNEPQGVAYVSAVDCIFVSNRGDGSLRVFSGSDFSPVERVELKADADNLRVDPNKNLVFAGFGSGGLAIIDARSRKKVGEIDLKGHPEGFQLEPSGERAFVNVPDARGIAVVDRTSSRQIATWTVPQATGNFPMAIRQRGTELLVGFRRPARLAVVDTRNGNLRERDHSDLWRRR